MIEIECSALSKQCLNRRMESQAELTPEVLSMVEDREAKAIKIHWQFSIERAPTKLNRHDEQAQNIKYQIT